MKLEAQIETKEELFEFLDGLNYVPSVFDGHGHHNNMGDALPWDLTEYIISHFKGTICFRSQDPDLMKKFGEIAKFFSDKNEECVKNREVLEDKYK